MPSITIKLNRLRAIELYNIIHGMDGEGSYKAARQQLQKTIFTAWPEIQPEVGAETEPGLERPLELNPKHQRAMAEGFLSIAGNPKTTGRDLDKVQELAEVCRVWGWVSTHLEQKPVPDFDGELDGEPALVDAAPSP